MELTLSQRQAMTKKEALAYRSADRAGKSRILDELVDLTGWHRDYARAALRDAIAQGGRWANQYLRNLMQLLRIHGEFRPISLALTLAAAREILEESGHTVTVSIDGELSQLPPTPSDTFARVTKEASSNIPRHAIPGTPCQVHAAVTEQAAETTFTNAWNGQRSRGLGLIGMAERVQSAGGPSRRGAKRTAGLFMRRSPWATINPRAGRTRAACGWSPRHGGRVRRWPS